MSAKSILSLIGAGVLLVAWAGFSAGPTGKPAASQPAASAPADVPAVWKEMFPQGLIDADGNAADLGRLKGKIVGLYFSAHWCPPCAVFTPKLVQFRADHAADFEVVFVSSDRTKEEHRKYMAEAAMKWLAAEWRTDAAIAITKKFEIKFIPTLVILGPDGKEITRDGRKDVEGDANAPALPKWKK